MKNIFRFIGFLEGISFLLLILIAVPIKYLEGNEFYVKLLGMPHGILFVLYIVLLVFIKKQMKWDFKITGIVAIASIIPFGTFYVDKKYLRC
tara:strand:+ start:1136 stop:1411 length:276 start_codon:yes stop_codon:yes gene_type:complete